MQKSLFLARLTALIAGLCVLSAPIEAQAGERLYNLFASGGAGAAELEFDVHGNLFMGNTRDHTISKITSAGSVTTFATGVSSPGVFANDSRGDIYVINNSKNSISKITPDGHVTDVVAVSERAALCPDVVTICTYSVAPLEGLAFDRDGKLYVSAPAAGIIDSVAPNGTVTHFSDHTQAYTLLAARDGGLYADGRTGITRVMPDGKTSLLLNTPLLYWPAALGFDRDGNLYVANYHNVTRTTPDGRIKQFAAESCFTSLVFDGDGNLYCSAAAKVSGGQELVKISHDGEASAIKTSLVSPSGVAFDARGQIYVADHYASSISTLTPTGQARIFASKGSAISQPGSLAFDHRGNLFVANGNNTIGKIAPDGTGTVFQTGCCYVPPTNGLSGQLAFDQHDNLYVADFQHNMIRKIAPDGKSVDFFATPFPKGIAVNDNGDVYATTQSDKDGRDPRIIKIASSGAVSTIETGEIDDLVYMAEDRAGNLYAANRLQNTISKISPDGSVSRFLSGLIDPRGIAFDNAGNRYVADSGNNRIVKITPKGEVSVFAELNDPAGLVADGSGGFYVAQSRLNTVGKISPDGKLSVFATGLSSPQGLALDRASNLYVANATAGTVNKITPDGRVSIFATGLTSPGELTIDAADNLYVVNIGTNTVSKITPAGSVSAVVGKFDLQTPEGIAADRSGNLYVAQRFGALLKILPDGTASVFDKPPYNVTGLDFSPDGDLYLAMTDNSIRKVTPDGHESAVYTGITSPAGLAIDDNDNLFVANSSDGAISKVPPSGPP